MQILTRQTRKGFVGKDDYHGIKGKIKDNSVKSVGKGGG